MSEKVKENRKCDRNERQENKILEWKMGTEEFY